MKGMFDSSDGKWKRTAAVGKKRPAVSGIARRRRRKSLNKSRAKSQPAFRRATVTNNSACVPCPACPRMNEDGSVELFRRAPNGLKRRIIEIQSIEASGVRICIHVRANLCATQSQLTNAAFPTLGPRGRHPEAVWSLTRRIVSGDRGLHRRCDHSGAVKDRAHRVVSPNN